MATLPNEILNEVFKHLKISELRQTQLTCRQWYTTATTILYTDIKIWNRERIISFMKVIESEPTLGTLIKTLYFQPVHDDVNTAVQSYFRFITTYCTNLIQQRSGLSHSPEYWRELKLAKLPKLQVLEPDSDVDRSFYNEAALAFRKTLVKVYLRDQTHTYVDGERVDCDNRFYQLSEKIQEFEELQELSLEHYHAHGLAGIDNVIDKCKKLKHLEAYVAGGTDSELNFHDNSSLQAIHQCPNIKSFEGHYGIINDNNSLLYLMHKFTHLDRLILVWAPFVERHQGRKKIVPTTRNTMAKFCNYLIKIPYFRGQIDLVDGETKHLAPLLEKSNHRRQWFLLSYNENIASHSIQFYDTATRLGFQSHMLYEKNKLPHTAFIEESGHLLTDLTVSNFSQIRVSNFGQAQTAEDTNYYDLNWLQHLLQHCISLKSLRITNPAQISFNEDIMKVHHNLENLSISNCTDFSILKTISKFLPALTRFEFNICIRKGTKLIVADMPFTEFDLLRIETRYPVAYVKIVTPSDSYHFIVTDMNVNPCTNDVYAQSISKGWKRVECVQIHCKSLKRLQLFKDYIHNLNVV